MVNYTKLDLYIRGSERYERAVKRYHFVWGAIFDLDFEARVPKSMVEAGAKTRTASGDWTHATVNVPVEYARWQWGWSQLTTKVVAGLAIVAVVTSVYLLVQSV